MPRDFITQRLTRTTLSVLGIGCVAIALCASQAHATSATATLTQGSLAFVSPPPDVSFSATLNGTDQDVTAGQAIDVGDDTGSGQGWDITATSTTFSCCSGAHTLSTSATTIQGAPTPACDSGSACTVASNAITYPYSLPAGPTAPTATKIFNAATNSGLGNETVSVTWHLAVPSATFVGTYLSTWTLSLASGP